MADHTVTGPRCGRGHPGELGRLCPQCVVIRYGEADRAEDEVKRLRAESADYRDRLERAHRELVSLGDDAAARASMTEFTRLRGKAEGVALALDYLRGHPALNAPSSPEGDRG